MVCCDWFARLFVLISFDCVLNREEELLAAAEISEGPERWRVQHPGERVVEADHPSGQGDGDDGGPQTVSHGDELNATVRKLHH